MIQHAPDRSAKMDHVGAQFLPAAVLWTHELQHQLCASRRSHLSSSGWLRPCRTLHTAIALQMKAVTGENSLLAGGRVVVQDDVGAPILARQEISLIHLTVIPRALQASSARVWYKVRQDEAAQMACCLCPADSSNSNVKSQPVHVEAAWIAMLPVPCRHPNEQQQHETRPCPVPGSCSQGRTEGGVTQQMRLARQAAGPHWHALCRQCQGQRLQFSVLYTVTHIGDLPWTLQLGGTSVSQKKGHAHHSKDFLLVGTPLPCSAQQRLHV